MPSLKAISNPVKTNVEASENNAPHMKPISEDSTQRSLDLMLILNNQKKRRTNFKQILLLKKMTAGSWKVISETART
ncbi:MAG: hypothetical protein QF858_00180, partial [Candidatus Pacebacteria bacterium]|nr:hypothetical protein [Candidatus Paceibacterota bacterium]